MYSITGPLKFTVELKGRAKNAQGTRAGLYILGPKEVNGKSHWLQDSGTNAIWYYKKNGHWNIGAQDNIGSDNRVIHTSEDVAGPQEATTWKYTSGGNWIISEDILVFTFEQGMYINRMRIIWVFVSLRRPSSALGTFSDLIGSCLILFDLVRSF